MGNNMKSYSIIAVLFLAALIPLQVSALSTANDCSLVNIYDQDNELFQTSARFNNITRFRSKNLKLYLRADIRQQDGKQLPLQDFYNGSLAIDYRHNMTKKNRCKLRLSMGKQQYFDRAFDYHSVGSLIEFMFFKTPFIYNKLQLNLQFKDYFDSDVISYNKAMFFFKVNQNLNLIEGYFFELVLQYTDLPNWSIETYTNEKNRRDFSLVMLFNVKRFIFKSVTNEVNLQVENYFSSASAASRR